MGFSEKAVEEATPRIGEALEFDGQHPQQADVDRIGRDLVAAIQGHLEAQPLSLERLRAFVASDEMVTRVFDQRNVRAQEEVAGQSPTEELRADLDAVAEELVAGLAATQPFLVQSEGGHDKLREEIFRACDAVGKTGAADEIAAHIWKEIEPHLAASPQPENSGGVEEGKPTIKFGTVEVSTAKDFRHLEQWPAGFTLCGADMFPTADADGMPPRIGFSRGGGTSGKEPCPECVRRAQRFRSQRRITVTGMEAEAFHSAIPAEPPASTRPASPQPQLSDEDQAYSFEIDPESGRSVSRAPRDEIIFHGAGLSDEDRKQVERIASALTRGIGVLRVTSSGAYGSGLAAEYEAGAAFLRKLASQQGEGQR